MSTGADPAWLAPLVRAVQANAHIADARHAADLTLCIYLLQMREFYRWERRLPFGVPLPRADVGRWIAEREDLWQTVQDDELQPLPLPRYGRGLDPYDVASVNAELQDSGLVYGAGLIGQDRPVFVLARRHAVAQREGLAVHTAGEELARCLAAPPAALAQVDGQPTVLVRRESLARWCWEKFEAHTMRPVAGSALQAAVQAYGLEAGFEQALPRWLADQAEMMVLHELGELRAGQHLGPPWATMRASLQTRRADALVRALRDLMADCDMTLPTLLARGAEASLHVWFASFDGWREAMFPGLRQAYAAWRRGDGGQALRLAAAAGHAHFSAVAQQVLALHAAHAGEAGAAIEALLASPSAVCPVGAAG